MPGWLLLRARLNTLVRSPPAWHNRAVGDDKDKKAGLGVFDFQALLRRIIVVAVLGLLLALVVAWFFVRRWVWWILIGSVILLAFGVGLYFAARPGPEGR